MAILSDFQVKEERGEHLAIFLSFFLVLNW